MKDELKLIKDEKAMQAMSDWFADHPQAAEDCASYIIDHSTQTNLSDIVDFLGMFPDTEDEYDSSMSTYDTSVEEVEWDGYELPLYLEEDCYEMDEATGNIKIDKQIYDDFVKDEIIHVCFVDEDDEPTMDYLMKSEDDNWIYCEVLG